MKPPQRIIPPTIGSNQMVEMEKEQTHDPEYKR
jgi:hypothetical protein